MKPTTETAGKWLPIQTAPKDGSEILLLFDSASVIVVRLAYWSDGMTDGGIDQSDIGWWSYRHSVTSELLWDKLQVGPFRGGGFLPAPVAWMPLPDVSGFTKS